MARWAQGLYQPKHPDKYIGKKTPRYFFIVYNSKGKKRIAELIEIKPNNQAKLENVGKNIQNQASYIVNKAKWEAAGKWCKHKGIRFRILTESDIFK